jgi:hypothetical protein
LQRHEAAVIKMAHSIQQRVFLAKRFNQTASVITVQREFRVKFEYGKAQRQSVTNRLVNKFEKTGNVIDNKKGVVGKKKSLRTPENIHRVEQALNQRPKKSKTSSSTQLDPTYQWPYQDLYMVLKYEQ